MLKIVIAIFSILGLSLISSLIAAAAPGWIIGKWVNGHEISGSLLWIYYQNIKFSYSAIDDHFKLNGLDLSGTKAKTDGAMAFIIFALIALISGIIFFAFGILKDRKLFITFATHLVLLSGLFVVISISFYSSAMVFATLASNSEVAFGYSYGFAWFAMCLDVVAGFLMTYFNHVISDSSAR